ncbi:MAG: SulP family inorganic anion transporter [Haliscomenobacter sp.]|nr:SulP family inorganic anion transporter [Haliscomenobacter sp.]
MKSFFRNLGSDFPASIVVLLVALPLCLGIALGSSAPLFSGIIAGIVGGIVIGLLSGSHLSVSGPAAGLTVIVAAGIVKAGTYEVFLVSVVLAGILQIVFGYLRAGVLGDFVPNSVIKGMLAAIGIILILKQLPHLVGYDADFEGDEAFIQPDSENTFSEIFKALNYIEPGAVIIGLICLGILILWELKFMKSIKALQLIPGPLVAVIVGTVLNQFFMGSQPSLVLESSHLVALPVASNAQEFLTFFTLPDFSAIGSAAVWTTAITLALVASLETLLSIEAVDKLDPLKRVTPNNRELKAQGVGNMLSGLLGGLPVTSVIVRSSANVNSGGKTKASAVLHGVLMLACVSLIPSLFNKIPLAALAAVLIFVGYKLAKISLFKEFYAKGFDQFVPFLITILAILLTDLLEGIIIGILVGLFFMLRSNFRSALLVVKDSNNHYLVRLRKDVTFLNKPLVKQTLEQIPENAKVIIDVSPAEFIDQDIVDSINEFLAHAHLKNIRVAFEKSQHKKAHANFITPVLPEDISTI